MSEHTDLNEIVRNHAMLVSLHIKGSRMEIKDPDAAAAAAAASGAKSSAAFYAKKNLMFGADARLKRLISLGAALRTTHNELTMAWDTGKSPFRMLPVVNFQRYTQAVATAKNQYEEALQDFIDHYEEDCIKARENLNISNDVRALRLYPAKDSLASKFGIEVLFEPIPQGTQFRNIPEGTADALSRAYEKKVSQRFRQAIVEALEGIGESLVVARTNLSRDDEGKTLRFKDSTITNIVDAGRMLRTFNLTHDEAVDQFAVEINRYLSGIDAAALKELRKAGADRQDVIDAVTTLEVKLEELLDSLRD